jgi:SAM-dependent methyltransferase
VTARPEAGGEDVVLDSFERIWQEWLRGENLDHRIREHLDQRRPMLDFLERSLERLAPGSAVLEIGAGTAIDTAWLSLRYPQLRFTATDLSASAIELARRIAGQMGARVELRLDDATKSDLGDASFELVFSQGVVEHFKDPRPIMAEQVRCLKPGGTLVVDVPQKFNPYTIYKHRAIARGTWQYGWETEYSLRQLRRLGKRLGLKAVRWMGYGYAIGADYKFNIVGTLGERVGKRFPRLAPVGALHTSLARRLERRFGAYFMLNVVVAFEKSL